MDTQTVIVLVIVVGLVLGFLSSQKGGSGNQQAAPIPTPTPRPVEHPDLVFSYYGSMPDQLEATKDYVNTHHVTPWAGAQLEQVQAAVDAGLKVILTPSLYTSLWLESFFSMLQQRGLLNHIIALYWDEPDQNPHPDMKEVRYIMGKFPEMSKCKIACCFSTAQNTPNIEDYDVVGVSAYNGDPWPQIRMLRSKLAPSQMQALVMYGADPWRMHPDDFYKMALGDAKVGWLLAFTWFDGNAQNGYSTGIAKNGMESVYRAVGLKLKN